MLTSLRHWTVSCSDNQHCTVNLSSTGDHVLDVVGVTWHVNVRVVALLRLVFLVGAGDGNTALLLLRSVVDVFVVARLVYIAWKTLCQHVSDGSR